VGVTIHFEGKLKDDEAYNSLMASSKKFAIEMEWPVSEISETEVTLQRVKDEEDWDYIGPVKGIEILPHEACDPFRLEFDRDLYIQEFVKTQFAPAQIHVLLIDFLRKHKNLFDNLEIIDEGEFLETNDLEVLESHIEACDKQMEECLSQPEKYYGPVKLENGRIVDLMEK
jgi:hypothetical protein